MAELKAMRWQQGLAPKLVGAVGLAILLVVAVLSILAIRALGNGLRNEFASKGEAIALSLAAGMEQTVGSSVSTVQGAIDSNKVISGVCYIWIQDFDGSVLVHTFSPTFPEGFERINPIDPDAAAQRIVIQHGVAFENARCTRILHRVGAPAPEADASASTGESGLRAMDVAAPISGGALGVVHVGMNEDVIAGQVRSLSLTMILGGIVLGTLGVVLAGLATRGLVSRPVGLLTRVTEDIVERGDLTQPVPVSGGDEVGRLADSFRKMVERLRSIPLTLEGSVRDLDTAVESLSSTTRQQTGLIQKQASGLAEASATTQEIKQTSAVAAAKAESVSQIASKAEELSEAGQSAVESSIEGLSEIQGQIETIVARIGDLAERTLQVGEIIESVKDLADQSNVLALNAAIEAAKAGEFGRGFGVVAREIRTLADQSIQSTARIREILSEIQSAIRATVVITEEGKKRMEASVTMIRASGQSLGKMTGFMRESSHAARAIAASVNQQNVGITQINVAIQALNAAMEETMSGVQRTEKAAADVDGIAGRIGDIVSTFKV